METFKIIEQSTNGIWDIQTKAENRLEFVFPFYRSGYHELYVFRIMKLNIKD